MSDRWPTDSLRPAPPAPARQRGGFTLLEVLAAVAILSIWYLVIANAAVQGLRAEGQSRRRLEAGLVADRRLAEVEAAAMTGQFPRGGTDLTGEDIYRVRTVVGPFAGLAAFGQGTEPLAAQVPAGEPIPRPKMKQLLGAGAPALNKLLKEVNVVVEWAEGSEEFSIERTTYLLDLEKAREIYADPELQAARDGAAAAPSEEEE
jgi:prepilin-type N-terminal cleavage/methylation domain-containing protein